MMLVLYFTETNFLLSFKKKISNNVSCDIRYRINLTTLNVPQKPYHSRLHFQQTSNKFLLMEDPCMQ